MVGGAYANKFNDFNPDGIFRIDNPKNTRLHPTAYLGGLRGFWVKSKQSYMLSAEPSRWLMDGTPKFSSQNFTMLTRECSVFEI